MVKECTGSLSFEFQGKTVDVTPPWKRIRIPEVIGVVFGCGLDEIDRKELELRLDGEMSGEKLSFVGITREQYRKELAEEKLGALVMVFVMLLDAARLVRLFHEHRRRVQRCVSGNAEIVRGDHPGGRYRYAYPSQKPAMLANQAEQAR